MSAPVLVIDFGSQVTQLIARRVREGGVYAEIVPFNRADEALAAAPPKAIILSGGPASLTDAKSPRAPARVYDMGVPVLGICYGQQAMVDQLGGRVEGSTKREFGRATLEVSGQRARLEHEGLRAGGDRENPRAGRQGSRHLRSLRRRRFLRRRAAHSRSGRRPAHLHLRRYRIAARGRSGGGGVAVPRALQHSA